MAGAFSNSIGPGCRPWIMKAPRRMAAELDPGMPRLSSGTNAVAVTTLFAVSGAATPSGEPCPNSSGYFDQRLASEYDMNAATVPPAPGVTPSTVPITEPIAAGFHSRFIIAQLGSLSLALLLSALAQGGSLICISISETANRPTIINSGLMPPSKSSWPNVNRGTPLTGSEPTI